MFRVVPDQLRISDGWVRCGQCDEVFDANAQLVRETPGAEEGKFPGTATTDESVVGSPPSAAVGPAPEIAPEPEMEWEYPDVEDGVHPLVPTPVDIDIDIAVDTDTGNAPLADPFLEHDPHAEPLPEPEPPQLEDNAQSPAEEVDPDGGAHDPAPAPDVAPRYLQADVQEGPAAADPKLSFLRPVRARSRRDRPWVRGALVLLSLLLVAGLLLQIVVQERDRIAATEPAVQPFLESVCAVLACRVSPLRQIESVVIDSSSFTKVRADVYRLNFTLKNSALTAVATPAVELTLTDLQDQSVVRRVFLAQDFGAKQAAMGPGSEFAASLSVSVNLSGDVARISGYRLLAFYP